MLGAGIYNSRYSRYHSHSVIGPVGCRLIIYSPLYIEYVRKLKRILELNRIYMSICSIANLMLLSSLLSWSPYHIGSIGISPKEFS